MSCGSFRTAEDYRDHLPCERCSPVEEQNRRNVEQWVSTYFEARPTHADRVLERFELIQLLEAALPFVQRAAFVGHAVGADELISKIKKAIGR